MIEVFKDRYRVALGLATFSFVGILISIYRLYRLPHDLMLIDSGHPSLISAYVTVAISFALGALALWFALSYRNEVVVFRDKQDHQDLANNAGGTEANSANTISLHGVEEQLKNVSGEDAIMQAGLNAVCKQIEAGQGALYIFNRRADPPRAELRCGYALAVSESKSVSYEEGEGLIGQAAVSGSTVYIDDIPEGYIKIMSGLGSASPRYLLIVALNNEHGVTGVMEIASFTPIPEAQRKFAEDAAKLIAARLTN